MERLRPAVESVESQALLARASVNVGAATELRISELGLGYDFGRCHIQWRRWTSSIALAGGLSLIRRCLWDVCARGRLKTDLSDLPPLAGPAPGWRQRRAVGSPRLHLSMPRENSR